MKGKYSNYLFLLAVIIIALLGGFLLKPERESFLNLKQNYNSCRRSAEKSVESFREGMFNHYSNLFGRKSFF
jgi:hypothetical protein